MTGLWAGLTRVQLQAAVRDFLFFRMSRLALCLTQAPTKWLLEVLSLSLRCEANHLPPSVLRIKMSGAIPLSPLYTFLLWTGGQHTVPITDCVTYPVNCPMVPGDS